MRFNRGLEDAVPTGAGAAKRVTFGDCKHPLRLFGADLDEIPTREAMSARGARAKHGHTLDDLPYVPQILDGGAGRSPPQRPASQRVLAPGTPPVMVRAGTRPVARVYDVDRAFGAVDEEPGAAVTNTDSDCALALAREVGHEDVPRTLDARGEGRTHRLHPLKLPLDGFRYLLYTRFDQENLLLVRGPGGCRLAGPFLYLTP